MFENEARLRELSLKAIESAMSDEEFAELAQLSRSKQKAREDRAALIASLKDNLQSQGITIAELFSAAEIAAALPRTGSTVQRTTAHKPQRLQRAQKEAGTAGNWGRQKQGLVLVEIGKPGRQGLPSRYCRGQSLSYYVSRSFKDLDDGQLEANLERYTTQAGKEYFASDAGLAERAALVEWICTSKVKPSRAR